MLDLMNDLTLTFVWLIHNFELGFVDIKFRVLPTIGTTVNTGLEDWEEFGSSFHEGTPKYTALIGLSQSDTWLLILAEWAKYTTYQTELVTYIAAYETYTADYLQWEIDVQATPELVEPTEPTKPVTTHAGELNGVFDYVYTVGVKA